ncbi:hypothetical protein [Desulfosarcina sp.]|uniref:hypothetical protein n=1 Tax=Desulfosarcina sp. TaxID=2027861 RepID=UPI0029A5587D|nr:hypothetical protein [Desulfosarcina sp.]MDX2452468.1 hypothetical protein [Desulfosarcina sp.]MDX2490245.1 hypothetical protein [Desulfosarcina sp.]
MTVLSAETVVARASSWLVYAAGYLSAGKLLHAITVTELLTITALAIFIGDHPLASPALVSLCLVPFFTQLDARSRFQEYKRVMDQLARYGPNRRIFKSAAGSRCQRDAALAAARQLGYASHCRTCFSTAGYRWYHLLPDVVNGHPRFLISAVFWRTTFFMPTYQSRQRLFHDFNSSSADVLLSA